MPVDELNAIDVVEHYKVHDFITKLLLSFSIQLLRPVSYLQNLSECDLLREVPQLELYSCFSDFIHRVTGAYLIQNKVYRLLS